MIKPTTNRPHNVARDSSVKERMCGIDLGGLKAICRPSGGGGRIPSSKPRGGRVIHTEEAYRYGATDPYLPDLAVWNVTTVEEGNRLTATAANNNSNITPSTYYLSRPAGQSPRAQYLTTTSTTSSAITRPRVASVGE